MKAEFTPELQAKFINEVLEQWVFETDKILHEEISKKSRHIPEETIENIRFEILRATSGDVASVLLSFQDSGRHVDMRQLNFTNLPISKDEHFIYEWAKKQGKRRFRKGVPGYKEGSKPRSEDAEILRIANAIVASKKRGGKKRRRRGRWFNKPFYKQVGQLVRMLLREQADFARRAFVNQVKETFNVK